MVKKSKEGKAELINKSALRNFILEGIGLKLRIKNLKKIYDDRTVLDIENFVFEKGKIYTVLGRNGAGKTTLFNCIDGDILFESGIFEYEKDGVVQILDYENVGIVTASPVLPEYLTGYEFIDFFMRLHNGRSSEEDIKRYFELVHIEEKDQFKLMKEYSYGMKNKIQLLCCFIKNPPIILLDEPLTSFDIIVSHEIKEFLLNIREEHIIIMSTHIMQLAQDISDEIVLLHEGNLQKLDALKLQNDDFENYVIEKLQEGDN